MRLSSPIFANDVSDPNGKKTRPNWSLPAFTDWLTCKTWFGVCFSLSLADWKTVLNLHSVIVWICDTSVRRRIHHLVLDCASTALDRTLPSPTHPHSDIHTHAHNYTHTHTHTHSHTHTATQIHTHTHTHTVSLTHSLIRSHTHSHTRAHGQSPEHSLKRTV